MCTCIWANFNPKIIFVLIVNPWKLLLFLCNWMWFGQTEKFNSIFRFPAVILYYHFNKFKTYFLWAGFNASLNLSFTDESTGSYPTTPTSTKHLQNNHYPHSHSQQHDWTHVQQEMCKEIDLTASFKSSQPAMVNRILSNSNYAPERYDNLLDPFIKKLSKLQILYLVHWIYIIQMHWFSCTSKLV